MSTITVKQLREALADLGPAWDDAEVRGWMPGLSMALSGTLIPHPAKKLGGKNIVLIEANADDEVTEEPGPGYRYRDFPGQGEG